MGGVKHVNLTPLALGCALLVAGCENPVPVESIVNPSPLAHLTYDCSVLAPSGSALQAVFYLEPFDDGGHNLSRMCAVTWDGRLQGVLPRGLARAQSPDGSRLLVWDFPISSSFEGQNEPLLAIDRSNHVLERYTSVWGREAIWADDNLHFCSIEDSVREDQFGGQGLLVQHLPGVSAQDIGPVGPVIPQHRGPEPSRRPGAQGPGPNIIPGAGPHLLACSLATDRAVVLDTVNGTLRVVRLSDATSLLTHQYGQHFSPRTDPRDFIELVASRDGRYVAENDSQRTKVTIRDLTSGVVVGQFESGAVSAFTWNADRVVLGNDTQTAVVDWVNHRTIRRLAGGNSGAFARQSSDDVLVCVPSTRHAFGCDIYVIRGDGDAFEVARSVEVPWGL
jgi:hypothetical protein